MAFKIYSSKGKGPVKEHENPGQVLAYPLAGNMAAWEEPVRSGQASHSDLLLSQTHRE